MSCEIDFSSIIYIYYLYTFFIIKYCKNIVKLIINYKSTRFKIFLKKKYNEYTGGIFFNVHSVLSVLYNEYTGGNFSMYSVYSVYF